MRPAALIRGATPNATSCESGRAGSAHETLTSSRNPQCLACASCPIPSLANVLVPLSSGNTIGNRCDGGVLAQTSEQTFHPAIVPAGAAGQRPTEEGGKAGSAELRGPNGQCLGLLLNAVMVDHQNVDSQPLRQQDRLVGIDAVVDRNQQIGAGPRELMDGMCAQSVTLIAVREVGSWLAPRLPRTLRRMCVPSTPSQS